MKKQIFLKIAAVMAFFFVANLKMSAQGNFTFKNLTANPLTVEVWADYDNCAGAVLCNSGAVVIAGGTSHVFNTCVANGAWKYVHVTDGCGKTTVGYCGFPTSDTFIDCSSNTVVVKWIDEHSGFAN